MAERRGLLRGKYLSVVQLKALEILNLLDEVEKLQNQFFQFRLALVSSGQYKPEIVFPEYQEALGIEKPKVVEMTDPLADSPDVEYNYSEVEWKGSEAKDEYEKLMAKISSMQQGTMTGDQLITYPGQGEWR